MELFKNDISKETNLLPKDGTVNYFGKILNEKEANNYFDLLIKTIEWKNDEAVIFGKHLIVKRKADGLAAGKGVIICQNYVEALSEFELMIQQSKFGEAGKKVVVEEFLLIHCL